MKKIKILHLIKTLNLGGAELNLFNLAQAISPDKFEIHIGYSFGGEFEAKFRKSEVKLFKFAEKPHKIKSFASFVILIRLIRYILKNKIQIVHTHTFNAHIWGSLAAKITGRKIIEHVHDFRYLDPDDFKRRRGSSRQYKYVKYLKNLSDRVVVLTKQNRDFLIEKGLYDGSIVIERRNGIPMSGDTANSKRQLYMRVELGLSADTLVVLTPCRIVPEKNIDLIFRIAPEVKKRCEKVVFLICGNGPLFEGFKKKRGQCGLSETIMMIGFYPRICDLLKISDVFLLPSFLELHSIAILEAMSMKVPVVTSREVGCNDTFVNSWKNGVLLDPFNDDGWAEALTRLLGDDELRRSIGNNGYEMCRKHFDIVKNVREFERIYAELKD